MSTPDDETTWAVTGVPDTVIDPSLMGDYVEASSGQQGIHFSDDQQSSSTRLVENSDE